jgi:hypothetical protein
VTATLVNDGPRAASGVVVETRVTALGVTIWSDTSRVGTVGAGEPVTQTKRVEIGTFDAFLVRLDDGTVTVRTTVRWDGGRQSFAVRRAVL